MDWILLVLKTLNVSGPSTFFTAVNLLDRYLDAKMKVAETVKIEKLFLIGLLAILIASKLEDVTAIPMGTLLERAGHGRFTASDIRLMEMEMLHILRFHLLAPTTLYSLASLQLTAASLTVSKDPPTEDYLIFMCTLATYSLTIISMEADLLAAAIV